MRLPVARTSKRSGPLEAAGHGRTAGELCVDASFVLDSVLVLDMVMQRGRSCGSVSMKSPHHPKTSSVWMGGGWSIALSVDARPVKPRCRSESACPFSLKAKRRCCGRTTLDGSTAAPRRVSYD